MKVNQKIKIDLKEFIQTGKFDCLKLDMSKEEVLRVFPEPSYWGLTNGPQTSHKESDIWRYGNFELHFHEERLFMIFNDYINSIDGGKYLEVDKWVIGSNEAATLAGFVSILIKERIDFSKNTNNIGQVILMIQGNWIKLGFDRSDEMSDSLLNLDSEKEIKTLERTFDPNKFELISFCSIKLNT